MMGREFSPSRNLHDPGLPKRMFRLVTSINREWITKKAAFPKNGCVLHLALRDLVDMSIAAYDSCGRDFYPDQSVYNDHLPIEWDEKLDAGHFLVLPLALSKRRIEMLEKEAIQRGKNR